MLKNRRSSTPSGKGDKTSPTGKGKHSPPDRASKKYSSLTRDRPSKDSEKDEDSAMMAVGHWRDVLREAVLVSASGEFHFRLAGGADAGQFPHVAVGASQPEEVGVIVKSGEDVVVGDVVLEIQGQKVSGYTNHDASAWLNHCSKNRNPVVIKTVPKGRSFYCQELKLNRGEVR